MKKIIILGVVLCLFSACLEKINLDTLKNTKWELSSITGITLPEHAKATLNFGDSLNVSGKSFCNNYGGQAEIIENKVALKNLFSTKMLCQDIDSSERAYLNALNEINNVKISDGKLQLLKDEKILLIFTKVN
ncbi:META domain-containing protein [Pedobacter aquatilis]|uniref:META domain-containing protein n=1 Tax=Pedobacter aquatilis TaxID=351343 RepID=UPI0025B40343|nr:META domain-containing protein [Pedobacter aquatilis]MDN3586304.1 META domain-containing protein [Pedobacter aquatilis]